MRNRDVQLPPLQGVSIWVPVPRLKPGLNGAKIRVVWDGSRGKGGWEPDTGSKPMLH